jgi:hypothetical protein
MPHVHEVTLEDGTTLTTGPDIGGEADPLAEEMGLEEVAPGELRVAAKSIKATEVPALEADEARQAANAVQAQDFSLLPTYGQEIFRRMRSSSLRMWPGDDAKAIAAGWRAIRQKYSVFPSGQRRANLRGAVKSLNTGGTPAGRRGRAYLVRITEERDADLKYERTEQLQVPGLQGVLVTIGWSPNNHRNPISVVVPDKLVTKGHGMSGAAAFVRDHWPYIWRVAKGITSSTLVQAKRAAAVERPILFKRYAGAGQKYVADPREAVHHIAYGENYRPWEIDLQGEYATEKRIEEMAWGFLTRGGKGGEMHGRWTMPDGSPAGEVVESFIARRGDPDFVAGSWVTGIKFARAVWQKICAGEYVGTSIGGLWARRPIFSREAN